MIKKSILLLFLTLLIQAATAFPLSAQKQPPPATVRVTRVTEAVRAENSGLVGVLYYDRISHLSAEVSGQVRKAHFSTGDKVEKRARLVRIRTDFFDQDIVVAKARIDTISVKIENAAKDMARYQSLLKKEAVSQSAYDTLYFNHQALIKEREAVRAGLAKIKLMRAKCTIRAPFNGIILEKTTEKGDWVTPGRTLYRIGSTADLFVKVSVSENLALYSLPGTPVEVLLTATGQKVGGKIIGLLPVADAQTKNVTVKVRLEESASTQPVAENMSATVFLPTTAEKTLKMIPRDALVNFQGKNFVYTIKDDKAAMLPVTIVAYFKDQVGVTDPHIAVGMPVVVDGNERLRPDQPVMIDGEGQ